MSAATLTEQHEGVVTSTEDDEQRGRIRCTCPGLTGDEDTELPFFIEPLHDWGWFHIPDVGETVEIEVVVSSPQDEIFGQSSLEGINARWRSKRYYNETSPIHPDFLAESYGKRRGFATPQGHILVFDDDAGTVRLTWMLNPEDPDSERSSLLFDANGNVHIIHKEQHEILLGDSKVTITLAGGNSLTLEQSEGNATAKVGDGAVHVAISEHLESLYGSLKTAYDSHVHSFPHTHISAAPGSPTGPAVPTDVLPTTSSAPAWATAIKSTKVSIPDG